MNFKKIAIASDHAGYHYKEEIKTYLKEKGVTVIDFGTDSDQSCDYPDYIAPAAVSVAGGEVDGGIVLGGSGNGEAMVANRFSGVRCGLCWNEESALMTRLHNNANMISLGARMITLDMALKIVDIWMMEDFEGGRHIRRIAKFDKRGDVK